MSVVEVGQDFRALLSHEREFCIHSVFAGALNLSDGGVFLTMLPLGRGCGASYATLALARGESFLEWDVARGLRAEVLRGKVVRLGPGVTIDFGRSVPWQSPLHVVKAAPAAREGNLEVLRQALIEHAVASPFQGILEGRGTELERVLDAMRSSVLAQDGAGLEAAVAAVLGLGPGLTPSGDDLIVGLSVARAVVRNAEGHPRPGDLWDAVVRRRLGDTHALSSFFIERALQGSSHEFVENVLACLLARESAQTKVAARRLLGVGATSGFDIGLGLYLALEWQRRYNWCSSA